MAEITAGWELDVDRESDWLLVKLRNSGPSTADGPLLAEGIWELIERHSTFRLVLELDRIDVLHSHLIGQLVLLHKRLCTRGGAMRLCGLSPRNQEVLHLCRLDDRFPAYGSREEAVLGSRSSR